ncbi:hypothetical protein DL95DRAFT_475710 [Leptodontidium sp. 2 PMI_412]|nr:hypothetical protein DL95DRAFT_475710 [Leptodontidium sp. 2 PMI_412]
MEFKNWAEERFDDLGILRFSNDGRPLEYAVREPIKSKNWRLIRWMKMVPIITKANSLPDSRRVEFLAKEEYLLDVQEERRALAMYISEIKMTKNWYGTRAHFPNLIIDSEAMENGDISITSTEPLRWLGSQQGAELQISDNSSNPQHSASTTTTTTNTESSRHASSVNGSTLGSEPPSNDGNDDFSTTPRPQGSRAMVLYRSQGFRPSFALQKDRPPTDPEVEQLALDNGVEIEPNYEGEVTGAHIRDRTCPPRMNTAVYIKNVDPLWTSEDIFNCVHEGGIYKYSRQEPNENYPTCAVTLTFKHRQAAVSFLHRARHEGIYIHDQKVDVVPSINPCWGIELGKEYQTRVLEVEGRAKLVDADALEAKFHNNIRFTLVKRQQWIEDGYKTIHFHFESILAQSRAAAVYLHKENRIRGLRWQFVEDPCAVDGN